VVLEDPTGGADFNPDFDGGEECQRLTVLFRNTLTAKAPWVTFVDKVANLDELRQGTELWKEQIWEMIYVGGSKEAQDEARARRQERGQVEDVLGLRRGNAHELRGQQRREELVHHGCARHRRPLEQDSAMWAG